MTDLHIIGYNTSFGYEDSYNYYDIDVDKILLLKKSNIEYFIRYDVNKKKIVPLQLKINNFFHGELHMFTSCITLPPTYSDDNEFFRKCEEICDKINELIGIKNPNDFVEIDDDEDEFIMVEKIQVLLEINLEMILYLFLHLFLIIFFKHH